MDDGVVVVKGPIMVVFVVVVFSPGKLVPVERVGEDVVGKLEDVLSVVGSVDVFNDDGFISVK